MKLKDQFDYLVEVARKMGFRVFIDTILTPGGDCRVYENKYIIINKKLPVRMQFGILKEILVQQIDEDTFLEPRTKKILGVE